MSVCSALSLDTLGLIGCHSFGLPYGSVLCSLLYISYNVDIEIVLASYRYAVLNQLNTDDIQAYLHCQASNALTVIVTMER